MNQMQWRRTEAGHLALYLKLGDTWTHHRNTRYYQPNRDTRESDGWTTYQSLHKQGWTLVKTPQEVNSEP